MVYKPSGGSYSYLSGEETRTQKLEFAKLSSRSVPLLSDTSGFKRSGGVTVWAPHAQHGLGLQEGGGFVSVVHLQGLFVLLRKMLEPMNHRTGLKKVF